jgi:hypothetical protein
MQKTLSVTCCYPFYKILAANGKRQTPTRDTDTGVFDRPISAHTELPAARLTERGNFGNCAHRRNSPFASLS